MRRSMLACARSESDPRPAATLFPRAARTTRTVSRFPVTGGLSRPWSCPGLDRRLPVVLALRERVRRSHLRRLGLQRLFDLEPRPTLRLRIVREPRIDATP